MNKDEADRALAGLSATYDRIAAAMYAIDSHPGLGFLKSGGLTGQTAEIWAALQPEVDAHWTEFTGFGTALGEARTTRASRRQSDPEWTAMQRVLTIDLPRLAAGLESACRTMNAILTDVNASWSAAATATAPVAEALAALSRAATEMGDTERITPLDRRVALACDQALSDPLTTAPQGVLGASMRGELATLAADIAAAKGRLDEQARVRDAYPEQVAALSARIDVVAAEEDAVRTAYARAREKIVDPGLPDEPRASIVLRARLSDMDARRAKKDWRRLADDFAMSEASIARALERAQELSAAADGLVARRDELRGRLEAYRAKAASHRLDEHDTLSPLHTTARTLLYTAPCDLHSATKAVYAYQKALTELVAAKDVTR